MSIMAISGLKRKKAEMISKESDIEVCIHTVCSPDNVDNLYDVYLKTLEVGARRWRVFDLGYQGGITQNKEKFFLNNQLQKQFHNFGMIAVIATKQCFLPQLHFLPNNTICFLN